MSEVNYKIILIGNSGVGKTSLFRKLSTGEFNEKNISTIGIEKKSLEVNLNIGASGSKKTTFTISLYDTAGQEKFRAITLNYFKGSDGIFLLYDITNKISFDHVETWVNSIRESIDNSGNSKYAIVLIGNKLDLVEEGVEERQVKEEEAKAACKKYDMIWGREQSTKGIDIDKLNELFGEYVGEIYSRIGVKNIGKQNTKKIAEKKKKKSNACFKFLST